MGTTDRSKTISFITVAAMFGAIFSKGSKRKTDKNAKFKGINYKIGETGGPVITDNTLAFLEAKVIGQQDAATHTIFIGQVVGAEVIKEGEPMTYAYYHEVKRGTTPKSAPSYIATKKEA